MDQKNHHNDRDSFESSTIALRSPKRLRGKDNDGVKDDDVVQAAIALRRISSSSVMATTAPTISKSSNDFDNDHVITPLPPAAVAVDNIKADNTTGSRDENTTFMFGCRQVSLLPTDQTVALELSLTKAIAQYRSQGEMLVEKIHQVHDEMQKKAAPTTTNNNNIAMATPASNNGSLQLIPRERMTALAQILIETYDSFKLSVGSAKVDIGYHWTGEENLESIQTVGFLTHEDRKLRDVTSIYHGSCYGDGVYSSCGPWTHGSGNYGRVCVMVARLQGKTSTSHRHSDDDVDTVIAGANGSIHVLKSSSQALPLLFFQKDMLFDNNVNPLESPSLVPLVHAYHCQLQTVLNELFNGDQSVEMPPCCLYKTGRHRRGRAGNFRKRRHYVRGKPPIETVLYSAPHSWDGFNLSSRFKNAKLPPDGSSGHCSICASDIYPPAGSFVALVKCGHAFHRSCLCIRLLYFNDCPRCKVKTGEIRGPSPSGAMRIYKNENGTCSGHQKGVLEICYTMDGGIQKDYQERPGIAYSSTSRTAYLPDNEEGRKLLKRMKYAFQHGLTFAVTASISTGKNNAITWASIPHKTSVAGKTRHSYPDPSYPQEACKVLDCLGVPDANLLT